MGLKTPVVNGARQDLPCLESPEVNGARQPIASVKKYVNNAWQEIWCSWREGYIVDDSVLSKDYSMSASVNWSSTSSRETDHRILCNGTHIHMSMYASGSYDNTITGTVTFSPLIDTSKYSKIYVKFKKELANSGYSEGPISSLSVRLYKESGTSGLVAFTEGETDTDGYTLYTANVSSKADMRYLKIIIQTQYFVGVVSQWKYNDVYIKEIWCE